MIKKKKIIIKIITEHQNYTKTAKSYKKKSNKKNK